MGKIERSDPGGEPTSTTGRQVPGDLDQDGLLRLSDTEILARVLFAGQGYRLPCGGADPSLGGNLSLLDSDGNGAVDLSDAIYLLAHLYAGGPAPVAGTDCVEIAGCPTACSP